MLSRWARYLRSDQAWRGRGRERRHGAARRPAARSGSAATWEWSGVGMERRGHGRIFQQRRRHGGRTVTSRSSTPPERTLQSPAMRSLDLAASAKHSFFPAGTSKPKPSLPAGSQSSSRLESCRSIIKKTRCYNNLLQLVFIFLRNWRHIFTELKALERLPSPSSHAMHRRGCAAGAHCGKEKIETEL